MCVLSVTSLLSCLSVCFSILFFNLQLTLFTDRVYIFVDVPGVQGVHKGRESDFAETCGRHNGWSPDERRQGVYLPFNCFEPVSE